MEALLSVFIAVLLAETGGRVQGLSYSLQLRFESAPPIFAALALTTFASLLVAVIGGIIVAGLIGFDARTLLSGLALVAAGAPMALRAPPPKEPQGATAFVASLRGFAPLQLGDGSQFIVFALAARSGEGALVIAAGLAATLAAAALPILLADNWAGTLPIPLLRRVAALLLSGAGSWMIVSALHLI